MKAYKKFGGMILTSTIVMYLFTYWNTYKVDHIFFSESRAYMAVLMGASMAVIMLLFMQNMLNNRKMNLGIIVGSIVVFLFSLYLLRSQTLVDDVDYMEAMIPHHSIAILTSERAQISDPRVRKLADGIIKTQKKEIAEMKKLIEELEDE
jgi:FlaA1/EpsC-like NDP-sugar epimerase